jgi:threonine dehydrogenase-like Zn-dependent dehydrogenase
MKALWLENNKIEMRDVPTPEARGEALIKIRMAGVCSTDLELVKGYYPYAGILGHEFVGEVITASDDGWVGARVAGEINASCWTCNTCRSGRPSHCENRTVLGIANRDGVFAEYTTLPLENLHRVPNSVPDEMAVFTEPLAAALEIQQQVQIHPNDRVLVIGAGRLGQLIAQTLALTGCDLHVLARHQAQKNLLLARSIPVVSEADLHPHQWDVVVEVTGSPAGFNIARNAIRPRGTIVLKSTYKGDLTVNFSSVVVDEVNIIGSRCGPFAPALRLMEKREVDPTVLIMDEFDLKDAVQAMARAAEAGVLKVLLRGGIGDG